MPHESLTTDKKPPAVFEEVDGTTPKREGYARFRIGETVPWKGLLFEVVAFDGRKMELAVIGATARAKARLKPRVRKGNNKGGRKR